MAQEFDCFLTNSDLVGLLADALNQGCRVILNKKLAEPVLELCHSISDVNCALSAGVTSFFLWYPKISRYELGVIEVHKGDAHCWCVRSKEGGPVIEVYFFRPFEDADGRHIPCSLLTYHSIIENPDNGMLEPSGVEIKQEFGRLIGSMRKGYRRVKSASGKKAAYVSPAVDNMLTSGWKLSAPFAAA